jgi:glycosyltransferase involved in cell wall biosynthesis
MGFLAVIPPAFYDGVPHRFDLLAEDGEPSGLRAVGRPGDWQPSFTLSPLSVLGMVEPAGEGQPIYGWVVVSNRTSGHKRVRNEVLVTSRDGAVARINAVVARPDVAESLGCEPHCGFWFEPTTEMLTEAPTQLNFLVLPERIPLPRSPVELAAPTRPIAPRPAPPPSAPPPAPPPAPPAPAAPPAAAAPEPEPEPEPPPPAPEPEPEPVAMAAPEPEPPAPEPPPPPPPPAASPHPASAAERVLAAEFDRVFYLDTYADVRANGIDPIRHYHEHGWREGRNPTPWFDTRFYLSANPDVRDAGVNPFWHYLSAGRDEGRAARRAGGHRRALIEALVPPEQKTAHYERAAAVLKLLPGHLEKKLDAALAASGGLVLSVSHDCYIRSVGGVQLFIDDEQRAFARRRLTYLHLSPVDPDLVLAAEATHGLIRLVLDGTMLGVTSYEDLAAALARRPRRPGEHRLFIVHCLLGHHVEKLTALQRETAAAANYFWLHDYSSMCPGYNLLRNDVAFCHAPPPGSDACLVCIYGDSRAAHLARIGALFEAVPFTVVAPSQAALDIWQAGVTLPHLAALVHPHCRVEANAVRTSLLAAEAEPVVRVAFVGYAVPHKGWPLFQELVNRTGRLGCYRFYHFITAAHAPPPMSRVEQVHVQTAPGQRDAMIEALAAHGIDLVAVLSPWPETFSYVTFEALAAGADIVALADSGNVAATIARDNRGIVVADEEELYALFESLAAVDYVRQRAETGIPAGTLEHIGTTATIEGAVLPESVA